MNLHEYQSKNLFAKFNIPVPKGRVTSSPQDVYDTAKEIGSPVVVKAQVLTGGRGKAGGVKLARIPDEARTIAEQMLGMTIKNLIVHKVLIDPAVDIRRELHLSVSNDRPARKPTLIASTAGGMDIEEIMRTDPDKIVQEYIDPLLGLRDYQSRNLAASIHLPRELWKPFIDIARGLYQCFVSTDATLCEINPLVITGRGTFMALDGKLSIDDNALFRQPELAEMRDLQAEPSAETRAREAGLSYIKLDGNIGCMVNGAGLAMTTMDIINDISRKMGTDGSGPANFLDIGGGAKAEKVAAALRIILAEPKVKAVLLNIFGGITRGDEVARGILQALEEIKSDMPMVVRLVGTNAEEGRHILELANKPNIQTAATLVQAAEKAVVAARGAEAWDVDSR